MEDAKDNAESAAVVLYEREISNLKAVLEREQTAAKESDANLRERVARASSELESAHAAFELERVEFARKEFTLVESVEELSSRASLYDKAFALNRQARQLYQSSSDIYYRANDAASYDDWRRSRNQVCLVIMMCSWYGGDIRFSGTTSTTASKTCGSLGVWGSRL